MGKRRIDRGTSRREYCLYTFRYTVQISEGFSAVSIAFCSDRDFPPFSCRLNPRYAKYLQSMATKHTWTFKAQLRSCIRAFLPAPSRLLNINVLPPHFHTAAGMNLQTDYAIYEFG